MSKKEKNVNKTHLEMIQNVISRMGQNSVRAKEWCITVDSAFLVFLLSNHDSRWGNVSLVIAIVVTVLFYGLDAYYLYLERGFRGLYDMAARVIDRDADFAEYSMKVPKDYKGALMYLKAAFSFVTGVFYGIILVSLIMVYCFV